MTTLCHWSQPGATSLGKATDWAYWFMNLPTWIVV